MTPLIAPSLLSADFSRLGEEMISLEKAGADWIHVDVMDGHFVPNLTIGPPVLKKLKPRARLPLDVHLMVSQPETLVDDFLEAGADSLTLHIESTSQVEKLFSKMNQKSVKKGLALKPGTPVDAILPFLGDVDLILVRTVSPDLADKVF